MKKKPITTLSSWAVVGIAVLSYFYFLNTKSVEYNWRTTPGEQE